MVLSNLRPIVILTGAGVSAESGINTFRGADGLWENHRIEDVASPEGFQRDPALVQHFYNLRRSQVLSDSIQPNAAHHAIAKLSQTLGSDCQLVTQNVDDLHQRAGTLNTLAMHGELLKAFCQYCGHEQVQHDDLAPDLPCPKCEAEGGLRPDIVWFGEMPKYMDTIYQSLDRCALFIAIGTSGNVYPAAGFVQAAKAAGAYTIEANLEAASNSGQFDEFREGPATVVIPALVKDILGE